MRLLFPIVVLLAAAYQLSALPANEPIRKSPILDGVSLEALQALGRKPEDYREPGSLPYTNLPPRTDTIPGIKHIDMLMMETTPLTT